MSRTTSLWAGVICTILLAAAVLSLPLEQRAEAATDRSGFAPAVVQLVLTSFGTTASTTISPPRVEADVDVQPLGPEDYLALLPRLVAPQRDPVRAQSDLASIEVGPATLALSRYFPARAASGAQVWIEVTLPEIPNVALLPNRFARVDIERVQRADGTNVYSPAGHSGRGRLTLSSGFADGQASGIRTVQLANTVQRDDIAFVTGRLALDLPINVQTIRLGNGSDSVPQLAASGASVELIALRGGEVAFRTTGRPEAYVTVLGYDRDGQRLNAAGESVSANGIYADRKALFHGELDHVEVVFTEGYLTKTYPFVLKGPAARRRQSFGVPPKTSDGPIIVELRRRGTRAIV